MKLFTVIGVGKAGGNAVRSMLTQPAEQRAPFRFVVLNASPEFLSRFECRTYLIDGADWDRPLTAELGETVFILAGLGGSTGGEYGCALARLAKQQGAKVIAVVSTPFRFEGPLRTRRAESDLKTLNEICDEVWIFPNEALRQWEADGMTPKDCFAKQQQQMFEKITRFIS